MPAKTITKTHAAHEFFVQRYESQQPFAQADVAWRARGRPLRCGLREPPMRWCRT